MLSKIYGRNHTAHFRLAIRAYNLRARVFVVLDFSPSNKKSGVFFIASVKAFVLTYSQNHLNDYHGISVLSFDNSK